MKCSLCGCRFQVEDAQAACANCPLGSKCRLVRCPNCGFEIPMEPKLVSAFKNWRKRRAG